MVKTLMIVIVFTLAYQICTVWQCRGLKLQIKDLAVGGIMCALTIILSTIMIPLPTGATINLGSMIPLMLLALIYDAKVAMVCGWVCGVLAMFLLPNWQPIHWAQVFVEHLVCFSCLGYTGVFGSSKRKDILMGALIAVTIKFFGHLISGVVFFSQNAWDGWGAWGYSFMYNLSSNLPESIASIVLLLLLPIQNIKNAIKGREKQ